MHPASPTSALRLARRRLLTALLLLVTTTVTLVGATPAEAVLVDPFNLVYTRNITGGVLVAGNSSMSCPTAVSGCTAARSTAGGGAASVSSLNNNNWDMAYTNVDSATAGNFDSSTSTVNLPTGSTVLFAALVWSARTGAGTNGVAAPTLVDKDKVKLRVPGAGSYTTVSSSRTSTSDGYQGYADVTSQVTAGGSGDYTVANIQAGTGQDRYAGWSLAIAYKDPTAPLRNLSVFSGFATVSSASPNNIVDIPVSGFTTPPSGAVRTTVGAVSWEGDAGSSGDQLLLGPDNTHLTNLSDTLHAPTNVFNSVISTTGTDPKTRSPAYDNNLGVDESTIAANGILPNGSTSAVVRFTSSSETYFPGLMTFATDLYAPRIDLTKTATFTKAPGNTQTQSLEPGDRITYTINGTNNGSDAAAPTVLTDAIPAGTTYAAGSLKLGGGTVTDGAGDDLGAFSSSANKLTAYLGTGATPTTGGSVAVGASIASVVFSVTVDPVSSTTSITNTARIDYSGVTSGQPVSGASNTLLAVAYDHRSDLGVTLTGDAGPVQRGAGTDVAYHATVTNNGPYDEPAAVLTDVLPTGATVVSTNPSVGSCSTTSGTVTCQLGALVSGAHATVDLVLHLDSAPRSAVSTASVHGTNTDATNGNDSATATTLVNRAPTAVADSVTTAGGTKTFDPAANDTDTDPDTLRVTSVGTAARGTVVLNGNGTVTYTAAAGQAGSDSFGYVVSDGQGGTAPGTVSVSIPNTPPVANADSTSTTPLTAVDVDVLGNDTDANIPTIAGQSLSVQSFTQPAGGTGTVTRSGSGLRFTPSAGFRSDSTTFGYTVSDGAGGTNTATVTVTIADVAPVAVDDTASTPYRTSIDVDVLANDSDDNGDPLSVTDATGASHGTASVVGNKVRYVPAAGWSGTDRVTYTMSDGHTTRTAHLDVTTGNGVPVAGAFSAAVPGGTASTVDVQSHATDPNGDTLTVIGTGPPSHGTVSVDGSGVVHYSPAADYRGTDSFTYTVSDGQGGTDTATVSLTVANQPPTAVHDASAVPVNGSSAVNVTTNDTDPNGDALTVTAVGTPAHGTATITGAGEITYAPDADFLGDDTFGYTVSDGHGGADTATLTMTVANQPPVANPDTVTHRQAVGSPLDIDVLANDTDPNGDPLHLVTADTASVHGGTVAIVSGHVVYTPDPSYAGDDTFGYTVGDSRGGVASTTVTVHVVNRAPNAVDDTVDAARSGSTAVDVLANDNDPDADPLTLTAVDGHSAHGGTVTIANGQAAYVPANGYIGPDSFDYTVTDARGATATATVHVSVNNTDPTATGFAVNAPGAATTTVDVLAHASDPDGDALTVTVDIPTHGTAVVNNDGTVDYTPEPGYRGPDSFTYTVADGHGGTDSATVSLTVANQAPVAHADTVTHRQTVGTPLDIDVLTNDTDPNSDTLTVTTVGSAGHGSVTLQGGTVSYTPDASYVGDDAFTYTITDGHGGTDTATVTVHVADRTPDAVDDTTTAPRTGSTTIDVLANDTDPDGDQLTLTGVDAHSTHNGTVTIANGQAVYTPALAFLGPDSFTYTVTDTRGATATATVTVTVGNADPNAAGFAVNAPGATTTTVDVLAHATDPDGDILTVTVDIPSHGTAVVNNDGTVDYTPTTGYHGDDSFTYTVSDGHGGTDHATVTVHVVNRTPTASDDATTASRTGSTAVDVLGNDTDPDSDALTVTSVGDPTPGGPGDPTHGTVALTNGSVTYTPDRSYVGDDSFDYTISDGHGGADSATVTVTVGNADPTAAGFTENVPGGGTSTLDVLAHATDPDGDALTVTVDVPTHGTAVVNNDGTIDYTPEPGYRGPASFSYTVSDGHGGHDTATVTLTVANQAPVAHADTVTHRQAVGSPLDIDVLDNDTDPNGDTLTVTTVGDATPGGPGDPAHGTVTLHNGTVTYTPNASYVGDDTFTCTISDGHGGTDSTTVTVHVVDRAPDAVDDTTTAPRTGSTTIDVLANDTDPDGDTLTLTGVDAHSTHNGAVTIANGQAVYTPALAFLGDDTFDYQITDARGATASATVHVTVNNADPTATAFAQNVPGGGTSTLDVLAHATDPDGDALTVTVDVPTHGTAVVNNDGTIDYTPEPGYRGPDSFTYTVADGHGGHDTATVTLTVANQAPVAHADTVTHRQAVGTPLDVDVLGNDTDPNSDTLQLDSVDPASAHGGTVTIANGKAVYTPDPSYVGDDTFTYTITDGHGGTDTATVTVHVIDRAPDAVDDTTTAARTGPRTIDVLANDADPDGDQLTLTGVDSRSTHGGFVTISNGKAVYTPAVAFLGDDTFDYTITDIRGATATATVTVTVNNADPTATAFAVNAPRATTTTVDVLAHATDPDGDPLTVTVDVPAHGTAVVNNDGTVDYTPTVGYHGDDSFSYTVADGHGGTDTATVTVHVINRTPDAVDDATTTPHTGSTTIDVLANDTDPDGDTLTVTTLGDSTPGGPGDPAHGTVALTNGSVTYTPDASYVGGDSFDYTITDGHGGTDTATVTVTVGNADPTAAGFAVNAPGAATTTVDVLAHASDPDGDPLTVTVSVPTHGTAVVNNDGTIDYTPEPGYRGPDSFSYTVADGHGGTDTATVTLTVANQAPDAHADTVTHRQTVGTPLDIDVLANDTDPNLDTLTVTTVGSAAHGSVTLHNGTVTYTPDASYVGDDAFTYTITDGHGGTDSATVTVTVVNRAPHAVDDSFAADPDTASTFDVLANDSDPDGEALTLSAVGAPSAQHGTVTIVDGKAVYTPTSGYVGLDSFGYTVSDARGATSSAVVSLRVNDHRPTPAPDHRTASGPVGSSVSIDVLANDGDPDGDALHLFSVSSPRHGRAVIVGGHVVYTPDATFAGTDTFDYTVADAFGRRSTETVTVTVVNHAPRAIDDRIDTTSGVATRVHVLRNDTDRDDETLSVRSVQRRTTAGGTARLHDGIVSYTSPAGFVGADSFGYTTMDPRGGTASATVHVLVRAAGSTPTPTPTPSPTPTPTPTPSPTPSTSPLTVVPASDTTGTVTPTSTLPDTGGPAAWLAWWGLASVLGGALLVGAAVRRPRRRDYW